MAASAKKLPVKEKSKNGQSADMKPAIRQGEKSAGKANGEQFGDRVDSSLNDLFVSELKDMFWAENHLVSALPKMIDASAGPLKKALQDHLKETKTHVVRLEKAFELAGKPALAKKCDAMEGLTMSGEHTIENTVPASTGRIMGIIGSGLKVENFEITCYKGLIQMAKNLEMDEIASLFEQTLQEEINAAGKLQHLSETENK